MKRLLKAIQGADDSQQGSQEDAAASNTASDKNEHHSALTTTLRRSNTSRPTSTSHSNNGPPATPPLDESSQNKNKKKPSSWNCCCHTDSPSVEEDYGEIDDIVTAHRQSMQDSTRQSDGSSLHAQPSEDSSSHTGVFTALPSTRLREIASLLESGLKVADRTYHFKTYKNCFVAQEAVDFMCKAKLAKSRKHAVYLGRALQRELNLWEHVCREHEFHDKYLFFRFTSVKNRFFDTTDEMQCLAVLHQQAVGDVSDTSSISSETTTTPAALQELATALEHSVEVKDHTFHLKSYPNTFVGSDAVDVMVVSGMAKSRKQAVELGNLLMEECNLFQHVLQQHGFEDDYLFYEFVERDKRTNVSREKLSLEEIAVLLEQGIKVKEHRYRLTSYPNTFVGTRAVDFLVRSKLASSRSEAVRIGRKLMLAYNLFEHVHQDHDFCDDYLFYRFVDPTLRRTPTNDVSLSAIDSFTINDDSTALQELARAFRKGVVVKTHKWRLKSYKHTFVGSEAVSYMVNASLAQSRKEAVALGRVICAEFHLFEHVTREHEFKDDYYFYRFIDEKRRTQSLVTDSTTSDYMPIEQIAETFRDGVDVQDRVYHLKPYKTTFVGREAVTFLVESNLAETREEAVQLGRNLAVEFNLFEHCTKDHEFKDAYLFYRFTNLGELRPTTTERVSLDIAELMEISQAFKEGVKVKDRRYHLRVYKDCFLGSEAVDFLVQYDPTKSRAQAVELGRALASELNLFEHVCRDHQLKDEGLFYRFVNESYQQHPWDESKLVSTGMMLQTPQKVESVTVADEPTTKPPPFAIIETSTALLRGEADGRSHSMAYAEELKRMAEKKDQLPKLRKGKSLPIVVSEDTLERLKIWSTTFRRADPRFQILSTVNDVAQERGRVVSNGQRQVPSSPLQLYLDRPSVFTVWRPTSFEAIRKMMLGEATGKGLDIKAKSAKRGKLLAYVPFLQINDNRSKKNVRTIAYDSKVRVFYKDRQAREIAAVKLEEVAEEMIDTVEKARRLLAKDRINEQTRKDAIDSMLWEMKDPSIAYIDEYSPKCFGLEFPARLFWEAYFIRQDCTRKPGSEYHPGRPCQPAYQDFNIAALRNAPKEGAPRIVVVQNGDAMSPFELLVAYEEHGRVLPVVSDFDCFLVGTRGVRFTSPLQQDQAEVLRWCLDKIQTILDAPPQPDNWDARWLTANRDEGFSPTVPPFGFGDPTSYKIIANTIYRLARVGAVRHGAECFNYFFPQALDEEFLVMSDILPGVRWQYMNLDELQGFLSERIDDGYTFPLNPKWLLCDPGHFKELYDKLMASDAVEVQESLDAWFPKDSGVREQIEAIHSRHPKGFQRERDATGRRTSVRIQNGLPGDAMKEAVQQLSVDAAGGAVGAETPPRPLPPVGA